MSKTKKIIILVSASICGLIWGLIYLFFATLHGMDEMFNNEFIFFTASLFNVELKTKITAFLFSFIDGALFGIIAAIILIRVKRNFK